MRKLVVILFSFLYSNIALAAPISSIEVEGNRKVEKAAVIAALESKVGSELNAKTIEDDIHNIYQLGFFSDIRIYKDGTKLIIRLKEKPSIVAIEYEGMDEVSEDDLEDKLSRLFIVLWTWKPSRQTLGPLKLVSSKRLLSCQNFIRISPSRK